MKELCIVAVKVEIIFCFASKFSYGDTTFLAVRLIGLELLTHEYPFVGIVAFENGVIDTERIATIAG